MNWLPPPESICATEKTVDIWRLPLFPDSENLLDCHSWLSPHEKERAGRFIKEIHSRRFILGRGGLREILSRYEQTHPSRIKFRYNIHGKPELAGNTSLRFNLSHSKDLALAAVTANKSVGIDVEYRRENVDYLKLANRFFAKNEADALRKVSLDHRKETFFRIWTRKEAYIKAHGEGLSLPLDQFEVSTGPEKTPILLQTLHDPKDKDRWKLAQIETREDYLCTLACQGFIGQIRFWQGP